MTKNRTLVLPKRPRSDVFCVLGSREVGKRAHCLLLRQQERNLKFATVMQHVQSTSQLGLLLSFSKLNALLTLS